MLILRSGVQLLLGMALVVFSLIVLVRHPTLQACMSALLAFLFQAWVVTLVAGIHNGRHQYDLLSGYLLRYPRCRFREIYLQDLPTRLPFSSVFHVGFGSLGLSKVSDTLRVFVVRPRQECEAPQQIKSYFPLGADDHLGSYVFLKSSPKATSGIQMFTALHEAGHASLGSSSDALLMMAMPVLCGAGALWMLLAVELSWVSVCLVASFAVVSWTWSRRHLSPGEALNLRKELVADAFALQLMHDSDIASLCRWIDRGGRLPYDQEYGDRAAAHRHRTFLKLVDERLANPRYRSPRLALPGPWYAVVALALVAIAAWWGREPGWAELLVKATLLVLAPWLITLTHRKIVMRQELQIRRFLVDLCGDRPPAAEPTEQF